MNKLTFSLQTAQEIKNPIEVFTSGNVEALIGQIESEARSIVFDVETPKGRKDIASLAHKVSRSKVALDSLGKNLVGEWKAKAKLVNSERKQIRDRLDSLRDEVRSPLTQWEYEEKERIRKEKLEEEIAQAHEQALVEDQLFDRRREIERKEEELRQAEIKRIAEEKAAEEARLAKQKAIEKEKKRIERENRIRQEAAEKAKREAAEKARREREEAEQKVINARVAEEKAKRERQEAEDRRIREIEEQKARLKREYEEKEQAKLRQEAKEKQEAARKAANKLHQEKVNKGIIKGLMLIGISEEHAKTVIADSLSGKIQGLKVIY